MSGISVELVDYRVEWVPLFEIRGAAIRNTVGDAALRIDHIGSTSVAGLAAKPILDIQIALDDWSRFEELQKGMESLGYHWHPDNPDQRKRYFTLESNEIRLVNVHARRWGEFSAQAALLFRDYLRANRRARARYEQRKRELTTRTWPTIDDYADAKGDTIWAILREADVWGSEAGWAAGPSDA